MKYRRGKKPSQGARCFTMGWQLSGVRESPIATSQDCLHWSTKALGLRLPKRVWIPPNLDWLLGGRTDPTFIFCNKETWVVGGTIRYSHRQTKPSRDNLAYFEVLAPNSSLGLEGDIQKAGGETPPAYTLRPDRGWKPSSCCPRPWPRFRIGGTEPPSPTDPQSQVPAGSRPHSPSKGGIWTSPAGQPQERLWGGRGALGAWAAAAARQGLPPRGTLFPLGPSPDLGSRSGRQGSPGGLTRRSWLISS